MLHAPNIIAVLRSESAGSGRIDLRIVSWDNSAPVLEKRHFVYDRSVNELRPGRLRGLTYDDLHLIVTNLPEIQPKMVRA
jgi:hypothetical protein